MKIKIREDHIWKMVGFVYLIFMLGIISFPAVIGFLTSFKTAKEVYTTPPTWIPKLIRLRNYIDMFQVLPLARAFLNSSIIALGASLLSIIAALPAGYSLARFNFPGRRAFLFFVLGSLMFSPVVIIVALYRIMEIYDLLNTYPSLILTNATFSLPFCIWLSTAYIRSIPDELDEAASIDGANRYQALWHIILPLSLPGIATVVIFSFIQAWNEFLLANTFMNTTEMKPLSVTLYNFVGYRGIEWQYISGAIILATIPAVAMFLLVQRWLISGLSLGAVK